MSERRHLPVWQETILLVVVATVLAVIVKSLLIQAFYIPSESMEPTMLVNDKILVQKVSYWSGEPARGDVVVFDDPGGWLTASDTADANLLQRGLAVIGLAPTGGHLIKRVVGVGGDTVACCDTNGFLTVNGTPVHEGYVLDQTVIKDRTFEVKVKSGYLWVMGDNRANSADSVAHLGDPGGGQISVDSVVGKAWLRVWPMGRFGFIDGTQAFNDLKK